MQFSKFVARSAAAVRRAAGTLGLATLALAGCGGGSSQVEPFVAQRVFAFGDESSLLTSDGRKYSVNALTTDNSALDCSAQPIWVQSVASLYGLVFEQCNPTAVAAPKAKAWAALGAKADDVKTQIDAQVAAGGFVAKDLATVLVGNNDVLEQYALYPATNEAQLTSELSARGKRLAEQINRLVDLGAKVVVSTAPDLGLSPFGLAQKAANTDTDRAALLTRLGFEFNSALRINLRNDGRYIGLVLGDEMVQAAVRFPSVYGFTNTIDAVCTAALPNCRTDTLVTNGSASTYLWADATHLSYGGQSRLASLAVARAANNPF